MWEKFVILKFATMRDFRVNLGNIIDEDQLLVVVFAFLKLTIYAYNFKLNANFFKTVRKLFSSVICLLLVFNFNIPVLKQYDPSEIN